VAKLIAACVTRKRPFLNLAIAAAFFAFIVTTSSFQSISETRLVDASVSFDIDPDKKESFVKSIEKFSIDEEFFLRRGASNFSRGRDWEVKFVRLERKDVHVIYHNLISENKIYVAIYKREEDAKWQCLWEKILVLVGQHKHMN